MYQYLNQNATYRDIIPTEKGISIKVEGNAFSDKGTPHYTIHESMEKFWDLYRRDGELYGDVPTNLQYSKTVLLALQKSGFTRDIALEITKESMKQRIKYGLLGGELVPRIPKKIYQKI